MATKKKAAKSAGKKKVKSLKKKVSNADKVKGGGGHWNTSKPGGS
jgi:hypothetical protein